MIQLLLEKNYPGYTELETILRITEPLLYSFRSKDKNHLVYVLQNRSADTHKGIANIFEVFIGETTNEDLNGLLTSNISILEALTNSKKKQRIGIINQQLFPAKQLEDLETIQNRIPKDRVTLKSMLQA